MQVTYHQYLLHPVIHPPSLIFDVKKTTSKRRIGAEKYKCIAIKVGNRLYTKKKNEKGIQKSTSRSKEMCIHG